MSVIQVLKSGVAVIAALSVFSGSVAYAQVPTNDATGNSIRNTISSINQQISGLMNGIRTTINDIKEQSGFLQAVSEAQQAYQDVQGGINQFLDENAELALILNGVISTACGNTQFGMPKFSVNFKFPFPEFDFPDNICDAISQISDAMGIPDYTDGFYGRLGNYELAEDYTLNTFFSDIDKGLDFGDGCLRDSTGIVVGARANFGPGFRTIDAKNKSPRNCNDAIGTKDRLELVAVSEQALETTQNPVPEQSMDLVTQQKIRDNWEQQRVTRIVNAQTTAANMRALARQEQNNAQAMALNLQKMKKTGAIMQYNGMLVATVAKLNAYQLELDAAELEMESAHMISTTFKPTYDINTMKAMQNARLATPEERRMIAEYDMKQEILARGLTPDMMDKIVQLATTGSRPVSEKK